MKGFKGFDENLKCRDFQYKIGKEYQIDGDLEMCENGFHFCETPFDVFNYYPPKVGTRYCRVEATGKTVTVGDKVVTSKIKIGKEVSLKELYEEAFALMNVEPTSGYYAHANTSGYKAHANTSGYYAHANTSGNKAHANTSGNKAHANTSGYYAHANTSGNYAHANTSGNKAHANTSGYYAHANTSGNEAHANTSGNKAHANTSGYYAHANTSGNKAHANTSGNEAHANTSGYEAIACALGICSKAKAENGWIVITDWRRDDKFSWYIENIYTSKVGGEILGITIESNKWYWFDGEKLKSK